MSWKRKLFPVKDLKPGEFPLYPPLWKLLLYWCVEGIGSLIIYFLTSFVFFFAGLTTVFALYSLGSGELALKATIFFILKHWLVFFLLAGSCSYILFKFHVPEIPILFSFIPWVIFSILLYLTIEYLLIPLIFHVYPILHFK